jgi:hypothetical protein
MSTAPAARLIEVAFPETRKNDPSVTESLDINRAFSFEFAERMHKAFGYEKDAFWLLFPDKGEAALGIKSWEKSSQTPPPFTVASLDTADAQLKTMEPASFPKLIVSINPGSFVAYLSLAWLRAASVSISVSVSDLYQLCYTSHELLESAIAALVAFVAFRCIALLCIAFPVLYYAGVAQFKVVQSSSMK